ncbi:hypothetical protein A6F65_02538 [Paraurantiacibacter namhicola]|uniref:Fe2OG dioxygenase domain-containing protein n=1 Tax=Paraurantiacibacter namhicola TaxID=645517 RepID=A0A1C7DBE8_9SPHN|nr:hypothetical protein A6F65_02538 [Paraurantiacibacter namhicola]
MVDDGKNGFSISFGGSGSGVTGQASGFSLGRHASPPVDPMSDPDKLAAIGKMVRERLEARGDAEYLGNGKADLYRIRGFLDRNECRRLVKVIDRKIGPSTLFKGTEIDGFRTSSTHYFAAGDPDTTALETKIDALLGLPHMLAETTQGQRYMAGQQFKHHQDFFHETEAYWQDERRRGGQRTWTAMVYLNEPEEGGATDFKDVGVAIPPERGAIIVWNNMGRDGRPNHQTLHAGTPVIAGSKYVITQWYRLFPWSIEQR